jgi:polyhydroxyalkanoate synthase
MGKTPPAFDILFWNADATNLPAGLHRDFVRLALDNALTMPGVALVLGRRSTSRRSPGHLRRGRHRRPHHAVAERCYRSVNLLGSTPRFVLSTSGHIAALVNPPGNEKASFRVNDALPDDAERGSRARAVTPGTWWEDWTAWLGERSGDERDAPAALGAAGHPPLEPAPGTYVLE